MKIRSFIFFVTILFSFLVCFACDNNKNAKNILPAIAAKDSTFTKYKLTDVDNKLDPSCMMPLTAGIGDTAHYKNYVLGFCSEECKKEFLKNPEANLKLAQLKK